MNNSVAETLSVKINDKTACVGVIGMGYVGLPLAIEFAKSDFPVVGFDIDDAKTEAINSGVSYFKHISHERVQEITKRENCTTVTDFSLLNGCDCIIICVPTPLTKQREPLMKFVEQTVNEIAKYAREGQLVVLESTTYPGTTKEIVEPPLAKKGFINGENYFVAFSPEREDPGNKSFSTNNIPKVVGADNEDARELAAALYNGAICETFTVSSAKAAEATKLLENIFRSVNIALVNELKVVFDRMDIDIWEVIEAAKTKPFGYMPFYPGPGLGGHCIPIDPFYLTWKAREFGCNTRFIELAGEVNTAMPEYVISTVTNALNTERKSLNSSKILLLGFAYKSDIDDYRESPSLRIYQLLKAAGAEVEYHDPYIPVFNGSRNLDEHLESVPLTKEKLQQSDLVLISTAHTCVDYSFVGEHASLIVDTRNVMNQIENVKATIVKA